MFPIVASYFARKNLAELGFVSDLKDIDPVDSEAFIIISNKIAELQEKESKRGSRR